MTPCVTGHRSLPTLFQISTECCLEFAGGQLGRGGGGRWEGGGGIGSLAGGIRIQDSGWPARGDGKAEGGLPEDRSPQPSIGRFTRSRQGGLEAGGE